MSKPVIAIIGLNVVGASIGLALQRQPGNFEIVGHDRDLEVAQGARRQGAVQRTEWNLHSACDRADLIVLAAPLTEIRDLLTHIGPDLQPETLLFLAVDVLQPALELAATQLPPRAHVVAGHPILTGIGGALTARADLFDEVTFCLTAGVETEPKAMQLASDLVERIGAKPFFVDAHEHDGLVAGVEQLPQLLAAMLVQLNASSPAWREGKRLAGRQFAQSTELGDSAQQLFDAWQGNRANLLVRLAQLRDMMDEWQALLAAEPAEDGQHPLQAQLDEVVTERLRWEGQVILKQWDDAPKPERAEARGMFQQMFFGGLMGRRGGPSDKEKR